MSASAWSRSHYLTWRPLQCSAAPRVTAAGQAARVCIAGAWPTGSSLATDLTGAVTVRACRLLQQMRCSNKYIYSSHCIRCPSVSFTSPHRARDRASSSCIVCIARAHATSSRPWDPMKWWRRYGSIVFKIKLVKHLNKLWKKNTWTVIYYHLCIPLKGIALCRYAALTKFIWALTNKLRGGQFIFTIICLSPDGPQRQSAVSLRCPGCRMLVLGRRRKNCYFSLSNVGSLLLCDLLSITCETIYAYNLCGWW